ncbi:hypothetical protein M0R45_018216 [Rubus argutus]|uniref:Ubiquitin-like protease family profile domain-containing protein n=1 Tax=Rubus argutus TaxID=59490 RepID=A0AAW1X4F1_RUBAR
MTEEEANKRILQYGNVLVTNRELHILNGPRFLNDIIIEFYFLHISNALLQSHQTFRDDILLVSPALSFFLQQDFGDDSHIKEFVESNNVASKQVVMFTVNNNRDRDRTDGGSHWSLLVYYRKSNTFVHYDSLGCNSSFARELFRGLKKHVARPPESSSTTGTIVDGDVDSTNTSTINIGDVNSNNTTAINIGDVNSNKTSTIDIGDVDSTNTSTINGINGDGNSTDSTMVCTDSTNTMVIDGDSTMIGVDFTNSSSMIGGDSTYTSMIHDLTTSSSRVGGDYTNCSRVQGDYCTNFDRDDYHMEQYNPKKPRMGRRCDWKEVDMRRKHGYYYLHPYTQRRSSSWDLQRGYQYISYNYDNWEDDDDDDDDDFKEERCMPKQKNFYDCGLYVMEIARVICEWYYLDDEAKQQQPEHQVLYCKLGGWRPVSQHQ